GVVLGILGALAGVTASAYAFLIYMINGLNGTGNPYASRVGYCIAAFILAIIAGVGAALLPRQTVLGSILLVAGSILGFVSINLMYTNTWYALAIPLCILAAILALGSLPIAAAAPMQWALLAILAAAVVASYFFGGWLPALIFAALLILAAAVQFLHPSWIP
ncbi:MAG: hypothetical protein ACXWP6_08595, partial [Ktedonobacterales bacterium]